MYYHLFHVTSLMLRNIFFYKNMVGKNSPPSRFQNRSAGLQNLMFRKCYCQTQEKSLTALMGRRRSMLLVVGEQYGFYINFGCLVTGFNSMFKKNNSWHKKKNRETCKYFQFLFWGGEMMAAKPKQKSSRGKSRLGLISQLPQLS